VGREEEVQSELVRVDSEREQIVEEIKQLG